MLVTADEELKEYISTVLNQVQGMCCLASHEYVTYILYRMATLLIFISYCPRHQVG